MNFLAFRLPAAMVILSAATGCTQSVDPSEAVAAANSNNIRRVTNLYLAYQTENNWVGPADEGYVQGFHPRPLATTLEPN